MDVKAAISKRRAYKELVETEISNEMIKELAEAASLAPSCFNHQPWRYLFISDRSLLREMDAVFSRGNAWAQKASLVIVVYSRPDLDCIIKDREYYLYDSGIASGFIMLRATELGLVAHPIAGYSPQKVRSIFSLPDDVNVINLIVVGKHNEQATEKDRPERLPMADFVTINKKMS